jgi:hypothetical protein
MAGSTHQAVGYRLYYAVGVFDRNKHIGMETHPKGWATRL